MRTRLDKMPLQFLRGSSKKASDYLERIISKIVHGTDLNNGVQTGCRVNPVAPRSKMISPTRSTNDLKRCSWQAAPGEDRMDNGNGSSGGSETDERIAASFDAHACDAGPEALGSLCRRLSAYGPSIGIAELESMGIIVKAGGGYVATNAYALLTSNPFSHAKVQCFRLRGKHGDIVTDLKEFTGDIISQVEESTRFVLMHLHKRSEIESLVRKDFYEIPETAVRGAMVDALASRDYSVTDCPVMVMVCNDHVDIEYPVASHGISIDGRSSRCSDAGNHALMSLFEAIGFIGSHADWVQDATAACEAQDAEPPELIGCGDRFIIRFPRYDIVYDG